MNRPVTDNPIIDGKFEFSPAPADPDTANGAMPPPPESASTTFDASPAGDISIVDAADAPSPDSVPEESADPADAWPYAQFPGESSFDPDVTPTTPMPVYVDPASDPALLEPIRSDFDRHVVASELNSLGNAWETYLTPDAIDLDEQLEMDTVFLNMESGIVAGAEHLRLDAADSSKTSRSRIVYAELPFPPALAEKYEPLGVIACGAMATVYSAKHRRKGHMVAIKILDIQNGSDGHLVKRFRDAAKAWSRLRSPHIVALQEFGITQQNPVAYLVMEYVDGKTLADILEEQQTLPAERFVEVFDQVCRALRKVHQTGGLHRDVKPSNIMIVERKGFWLTKVSDFGIVKQIENSFGIDISRIGAVYGTPAYMSPEQCMGRQADRRSDMFSLGCVMYEAATGTIPGGGENVLQTVQKRLTETAKPLSELGITYPKHLEKAILHCLERDPERRLQNVDRLQRELLRGWKRRVKAVVRRIRRLQAKDFKAAASALAVVGALGAAGWLGALYLTPYNAPLHWQRYEEALQNHDDRKATSNLLSIIENAPTDSRLTTTVYLYATDLAKRGNYARAVDILEAQTKNFGKTKMKPIEQANSLFLYGGVLSKQGNDPTARAVFEQLVTLQQTYRSNNVTTGQAHQYLGDIAFRDKRPADAAHHYRKAIQLFGNEAGWVAGAAANYAALLMELRNYTDAERLYTLAKNSWLKAHGPKNATSVYGTTLLGQFYLKARRYDKAEDNFRESLQMLRSLSKEGKEGTKDGQYLAERQRLLSSYTALLKRQRRLSDLPKIEGLLPAK